MRKGISICFFTAIIILLFLLLILQNKEKQPPEISDTQLYETAETEAEPLTESMQIVKNEKYYLKESDGYLTVYESRTDKIYCETNIKMELLSPEIQKKIIDGIFFQTEAELYDFLESYSS